MCFGIGQCGQSGRCAIGPGRQCAGLFLPGKITLPAALVSRRRGAAVYRHITQARARLCPPIQSGMSPGGWDGLSRGSDSLLMRGLALEEPPRVKVERVAAARKYLERIMAEAARFRGVELQRVAEVEASLDEVVADLMAQGACSEALRVHGYLPKRVDMTCGR